MQDIATKLSRVAAVAKAAGLTTDQTRHLIHGTGGSPRRAKRAIRLGIHEQLIDAYTAALAETGAHNTAVIACNKLWADLVPSTPADADEADEEAGEPAAAAPAAPAAKRSRKPVAQAIAEQAVAVAATSSRKVSKARRAVAAASAAKPGVAELRDLLPA